MKSRILLVEDNHIHRLLIQDFFEHKGYTILGLPDGRAFLEHLVSFNPDLIILDLKLPVLDGFALLNLLQQSNRKDIPVIVVSAYAFDREKQRAKQFGIRRYHTKPLNLEYLEQSVEAELSTLA